MATRRTFSPEFKAEAVRQAKARGVSVAQTARELDLHPSVLRRWIREQAERPRHASRSSAGQVRPDRRQWLGGVPENRRNRVYFFFIGGFAALLLILYVIGNLSSLLWALVRGTNAHLDGVWLAVASCLVVSVLFLGSESRKTGPRALWLSIALCGHVLLSYTIGLANVSYSSWVIYLYLTPVSGIIILLLFPLLLILILPLYLIALKVGERFGKGRQPAAPGSIVKLDSVTEEDRNRLLAQIHSYLTAKPVKTVLKRFLELFGLCVLLSPVLLGAYAAWQHELWAEIFYVVYISLILGVLIAAERVREARSRR